MLRNIASSLRLTVYACLCDLVVALVLLYSALVIVMLAVVNLYILYIRNI